MEKLAIVTHRKSDWLKLKTVVQYIIISLFYLVFDIYVVWFLGHYRPTRSL